MKELPFKKIDAFATNSSAGNPAAAIALGSLDELTASEKLRIAREMKGFVSEVGFIAAKSSTSFDLSYYSSEREVEFCGHATIAILYDLLKSDPELNTQRILKISTKRGILSVENRIESEDAVFVTAPQMQVIEHIPPKNEMATALKIPQDAINAHLPPAHINAGLSTLIVPICGLDTILSISPDIENLKIFCEQNNIDIIEVFSEEVQSQSSDYRVRVFAPRFGYLEDPATGSGNSAFGYYLKLHSRFAKETITIEQNASRDHFNIVKLQRSKNEEGSDRILFGGAAITRIRGSYLL